MRPFCVQVKIDGSACWCYNKTESGYAVTVTPWRMPYLKEKEP